MRQLEQPTKEQPVPREAREFKDSVQETIAARSPMAKGRAESPFSPGGSGGAVLFR